MNRCGKPWRKRGEMPGGATNAMPAIPTSAGLAVDFHTGGKTCTAPYMCPAVLLSCLPISADALWASEETLMQT